MRRSKSLLDSRLLITAAVLVAFLVWAKLAGAWAYGFGAQIWFELLQAALIGHAPAASVISLRGTLRDLDDLLISSWG